MNNRRMPKKNSRKDLHKLEQLIILMAVVLVAVLVSIWRSRTNNSLSPVNLSANTTGQVARLLEHSGQYQVLSGPTNGTLSIYALGDAGKMREILVDAHKSGYPYHIYKFKTADTGQGYAIDLPPKSLSSGSRVNDTGLIMQYPDIFYVSSFDGQLQSINAYDLNNNKRTVFAFNGMVKKANLVPANKNQVKVQLVENNQNVETSLNIGKNGISSSSPTLKLMHSPADNTSAFIRLVEGVKKIMGNGTVAFLENTWYQSKDTFKSLLYSVNSGGQRPGLTNSGGAQAAGTSKPALPAAVNSPPLEKSITFPDPSRPYVKASLVKINPALVNFHLVAGTKDPVSVTGIHGSGMIPLSVQRQGNVIAAFNAGFQSRDGIYGFMTEQRVYQSPVPGLATFCIYGDGKVDIGSWGNEIKSDAGMVALRQNLHLLIDHGKLNPLINDQAKWGITVNNAVRVWRSGIGIDKQGRIIYAAGDSLTAETLARALLSAGCVRAMELDINSYWVTFNFFQRTVGNHGVKLEGTKLDPSMRRSVARYLTPDTRDFFYLTLKPLNNQTTP
ncbi:hypothetical protein CEB3_c16370 [Peptococcaceae bacterium CEB3]|nr:hypothetical protein CEB3_c16370 [Peptococcaceae bacterium CEB3]